MLGFGRTGTVNDKAECGHLQTVDLAPQFAPKQTFACAEVYTRGSAGETLST